MNIAFAVLTEDNHFVENIIIADLDKKEELEHAYQRTLLDARVLGLAIGDYCNGTDWTRNVDGVQTVLPLWAHPAVQQVIDYLNGITSELPTLLSIGQVELVEAFQTHILADRERLGLIPPKQT